MSQIETGVRRVLSSPVVYSGFQYLMGAHSGWQRLVNDYIRPFVGARVLDVGCGPADLLGYLHDVEYWGYDISADYIAHARQKYGARGHFVCGLLTAAEVSRMPEFDRVVLSGVLHHLDDDAAHELLRLVRRVLKPEGHLVTVDPCLVDGQNPVARFLIERDRGQNVRTEAGYADLVKPVFGRCIMEIRHKAWIPYTHCYMVCSAGAQ
ncbi:MAG: class I SAM-dependent methyltransferase [Thiobacillus sp.]|nr:class I SAM-dependent methyltransferase [Thiobacillus sp.]